MLSVIASLLALLAGPAMAWWAGRRRRWIEGIGGFVRVALLGLVFLHLLPPALHAGGAVALVALLAAVAIPWIWAHGRRMFAGVGGWLVVVVLAVHAAMDGMALALGDTRQDWGLVMAVCLHRVPMALALWWLFRPHGVLAALGAMAALGLGTVAGFGAAGPYLVGLQGTGLALVQALVAGSLLHVAFHRLDVPGGAPGPSAGAAATVGGGVAVALLGLGLLASEHGHGHAPWGEGLVVMGLAALVLFTFIWGRSGLGDAPSLGLERADDPAKDPGSGVTVGLRDEIVGVQVDDQRPPQDRVLPAQG